MFFVESHESGFMFIKCQVMKRCRSRDSERNAAAVERISISRKYLSGKR